MVLSIEELKAYASNLMKEGLNTQQIADELSLSQDTITWLLSGTGDSERPSDVRIGWRTLGVRPQRIAAVGSIMADVADEELGYENIDTVVGIFHQRHCVCLRSCQSSGIRHDRVPHDR